MMVGASVLHIVNSLVARLRSLYGMTSFTNTGTEGPQYGTLPSLAANTP
jgi:hypothetical protein